MSRRTAARPRRRKPSAAARIRPFWILIAVLLLLLAIGGGYVLNWSGFHPKGVLVSGNRVVPTNEIVARAQIRNDRNLWLQNTGAMATRIETIPYIETAIVRRQLPATVIISVTERTPYAVLEQGAERVTVDHTLRVLQADPVAALPTLVASGNSAMPAGSTVADPTVRALRDDLDALQGAHLAAVRLSNDRFGQLIVTLRDGVRVLLGDDDDRLQQKIELIQPILDQAARGGHRVAQVDLRAVRTPVVIYRSK